MRTIKYISLFSGGFGLDLGIEQATTGHFTFELLACLDKMDAARKTIRHNRPYLTVIGDEPEDEEGDITKIGSSHILQRADTNSDNVDLVVGGPPCQAWSILGSKKGFEDPRGKVLLEFIRCIRDIRPLAFIMENVGGLTHKNNLDALNLIKEKYRDSGYSYLNIWHLNAADYGVPQIRKRVFIIGFRDDTGINFEMPPPSATHQPNSLSNGHSLPELPPYLTVRDAFGNMPDDVQNNEPRMHGERVLNRYKSVPQGGRDAIDHTDRLEWGMPSGTVLVGSSKGGGRPFIHPEIHRHITVREAARLQGFPDNWVFKGGSTAQYRQVGNAVPPKLGKAVAAEVAKYFIQTNN